MKLLAKEKKVLFLIQSTHLFEKKGRASVLSCRLPLLPVGHRERAHVTVDLIDVDKKI